MGATVDVSQLMNEHGFHVSDYIGDYTKIQEGPPVLSSSCAERGMFNEQGKGRAGH